MTSSTTTCKSCGRYIVWVTMPSGKAMPCDPAVVVTVSEAEPHVTQRGRVSHFATCTNAEETVEIMTQEQTQIESNLYSIRMPCGCVFEYHLAFPEGDEFPFETIEDAVQFVQESIWPEQIVPCGNHQA